jgi:hypothetical protein
MPGRTPGILCLGAPGRRRSAAPVSWTPTSIGAWRSAALIWQPDGRSVRHRPIDGRAAGQRAASARRSSASETAFGRHRPVASPGPRGQPAGDARCRIAPVADPLGAAGRRQDHHRAAAGRRDRSAFRPDQRDLHRRAGPAQGVRGREDAPRTGRARCCSSTRSTASTRRSRTGSCRIWRTARSCWSGPPPKTRPSS